jgi:hypothetical protein
MASLELEVSKQSVACIYIAFVLLIITQKGHALPTRENNKESG